MPHRPKTIDGTAASRSTMMANGRASLDGAYWVKNTAIPIATGTARTRAKTELSTVTMKRSRIPNARFSASLVLKVALVKKFAWLARSDGHARINRKIAISAMAMTTVEPVATASDLNARSPKRPVLPPIDFGAGLAPRGSDTLGMVAPGGAVLDGAPSGRTSGCRAMRTSDHAIAFTAVASLDLNES